MHSHTTLYSRASPLPSLYPVSRQLHPTGCQRRHACRRELKEPFVCQHIRWTGLHPRGDGRVRSSRCKVCVYPPSLPNRLPPPYPPLPAHPLYPSTPLTPCPSTPLPPSPLNPPYPALPPSLLPHPALTPPPCPYSPTLPLLPHPALTPYSFPRHPLINIATPLFLFLFRYAQFFSLVKSHKIPGEATALRFNGSIAPCTYCTRTYCAHTYCALSSLTFNSR
jgi:hypothetical protein